MISPVELVLQRRTDAEPHENLAVLRLLAPPEGNAKKIHEL